MKAALGNALLLALIFAITAGCAESTQKGDDMPPFVLDSVSGVEKVAQLTGKASFNRTDQYNVYGTDLGIMFEHKNTMYFVFGDTFGPREDTQTGAGGQNWRGNVMAFSTDQEPSDGITFDGMITGGGKSARELLYGRKQAGVESSKIPTAAFSANGNMYIHYMSVKSREGGGIWTTNYSGLAKSEDDGQTWSLLTEVTWPGDSHFVQAAVQIIDGEIYFWSLPTSRTGGVRLMKVKAHEVEQLDKYVYFSGMNKQKPRWSSDMADAVQIIEPAVGEFSVAWNDYLQRYIMLYLNKSTHMIEIRESTLPWGPWSDPVPAFRQSAYPASYGPFMHPNYVEDGGKTIYFTLSQWEPYNVFWMKMTLVKKDNQEAQ